MTGVAPLGAVSHRFLNFFLIRKLVEEPSFTVSFNYKLILATLGYVQMPMEQVMKPRILSNIYWGVKRQEKKILMSIYDLEIFSGLLI